MSEIIVTVFSAGKHAGKIGITHFTKAITPASVGKMLFEFSRDTDKTGHFNPQIHTLAAIAQGVPGHFPLSSRQISETDLPQDNCFRDAWEDTGTVVQVNMTKARAIHLTEIRRVRNAELVKEDVTFMRAVEAGDTSAQATVATEKQVLRDIPATFDITTGVDTPEKLKAKWPTELPARE